MPTDKDSHRSSHREMLIEHLLIADIMKHLWLGGAPDLDVLKPQTDESGYDLALDANDRLRHVQLKSSSRDAKTASVNVNVKLARKPSGCVVWVLFDPETMALGPLLWFGGAPGERLPPLTSFRTARHTKGNAQGVKLPRANLRVIPRTHFEPLANVDALVRRLFG
jgi:hypothetical protein